MDSNTRIFDPNSGLHVHVLLVKFAANLSNISLHATCRIYMCMSYVHVQVLCTCACLTYMYMCMSYVHVHVHVVCTCACRMCMSYLQVHVVLGRCYPCVQLVDVSCTCGATKIKVACGRERSIKRPKCKKLCQKPSECHHHTPHLCHEGKCPPCRQTCGKTLPCQHSCTVPCHSRPHLATQVNSLA